MLRKISDINATRTSGSGELYALPKETERAIPVVATAQFVVLSRRVRQILLRYISPLYRWASIPSSAALNGFLGGSATLMRLPPVKVRHEVRKGTTARKVKNRQISCQTDFARRSCLRSFHHQFLGKSPPLIHQHASLPTQAWIHPFQLRVLDPACPLPSHQVCRSIPVRSCRPGTSSSGKNQPSPIHG